jgi:hypothetical protein
MEIGVTPDHLWYSLSCETSLRLHLWPCVGSPAVTMSQRVVGQGP